MRIAVAGAGAFGIKHLDALAAIDGVTVTSVVSRRQEQAEEVARKYGVGHASTDLDEVLARDDVDAVILCTPTQLHAQQAIAAMRAGKHVQVEIPVADSWADAQQVDRVAAGDRPGLHGRAHPPVQPLAPVDPPPHRRGGAGHPADGRADLLLPPHEPERARPAPQLDRSPALAPRRAHRRPVPVPDRRGRPDRPRGAGAGASRARHRDGHVHPAADARRRASAPSR